MQLGQKIKPAPKEEKSYGHLNLNSATAPFVKDCKIGEEKEVTIKIRVKGLRQPDRWEVSEEKMKPTDVIASVNVIGISHKSSKKKEKDED
jgi:hypothetical protein